MKYLKSFIFTIVLFAAMLNMTLIVHADSKTDGYWEYSVSAGEAEITGYNGNSLNISIPSRLGGYPVTGIGREVFYNSNIRTLTIPEGIEDIGIRAFANCKYLTQINFNAKKRNIHLTSVFVNAGKFSDSLTVIFGSSVKEIPSYLFAGDEDNYAHVTKVVISDSVEVIGARAFCNCFDLEDLQLGNGVLEIGSRAFSDCLKLKSITIPKKTEKIWAAAFSGLKYLTEINFNAEDCYAYVSRSMTSQHIFVDAGKFSDSLVVNFGSSVKVVPAAIFEAEDNHYVHVTEVNIPSSTLEIGNWAFNNCFDLKTITIASRVTKFPTDSSHFSDAFQNCSSNLIFKCFRGSTASSYAIQNGFKVSYYDPIIDISKCTIKLSFTDSVYNGKAKTPAVSVTYGNEVLAEGNDYTISYKNNIFVGTATVIINGKGECKGTVTKPFEITLQNGGIFTKGNYTYKITNAASKTVQLTKGKASLTSIKVPETVSYGGINLRVTSIGSKAFYKCKATKATIGKNVDSIGISAFENCTKLKTVSMGANVKSIGNKAFYKCTALTKATIPTATTKIGSSAFQGCTKLSTLTIGKNVKTIGSKAFYGDKKLKTITIKTTKLTTKTVGANAFKNIYAKAKVTVPSSKRAAYKTLLKKRGLGSSAIVK